MCYPLSMGGYPCERTLVVCFRRCKGTTIMRKSGQIYVEKHVFGRFCWLLSRNSALYSLLDECRDEPTACHISWRLGILIVRWQARDRDKRLRQEAETRKGLRGIASLQARLLRCVLLINKFSKNYLCLLLPLLIYRTNLNDVCCLCSGEHRLSVQTCGENRCVTDDCCNCYNCECNRISECHNLFPFLL